MKVKINRSGFVYPQILSLFSVILLLLYFNYLIPVFASTEKSNDDDNKGLMDLNIKMNLNNIQLKDGDKIKIVAYVNGETGIQYLDPQKEKKQIKGNFLTAYMKFNKTNEISSIGEDEYFVCAYIINNGETKVSKNNNTNAIRYDCDEGQTVEDADVSMGRLFNTMSKFQKTLELSQLALKSNQDFSDVKSLSSRQFMIKQM